MKNYLSQRSLAAALKIDSATVAKLAAELKLGTPGEHKNSARTFHPGEAQRIAQHYCDGKMGELRNQQIGIDADLLKTARRMGQLASLARVFEHPAASDLRDLQKIVATIDSGEKNPPRPDLVSAAGKIKFLAALNPHRADLSACMDRIHAKI